MSNTKIHKSIRSVSEITEYGFKWGPVTVSRYCCDERKGWVCIGVETKKHTGHNAIHIYITKTGKITMTCAKGVFKLKKD